MAGRFLAWWLILYLSTQAVRGVAVFFAYLATNGASLAGIDGYGGYWGFAFAEFLISAILWLLVGVPQRAYWFGLGTNLADGARSLLVGLVTTAACVLSGIFVWLLLINTLTRGQLVAGIVFTVALTPPYYSAVARACCQRGFFGILKPEAFDKALVAASNTGAERPRSASRGGTSGSLAAKECCERKSGLAGPDAQKALGAALLR